MLPALLPSSEPTMVPPPARFRPATNVKWARFGPRPHLASAPSSEAARAGLRFEEKAQRWLVASLVSTSYLPSPWIEFEDNSGRRICSPDGLLLNPQFSVVVEIKIRHMPEAYHQLRKVYQPVVERLRDKPCCVVELVGSFDPAMPFPEKVRHLDGLNFEQPFSDIGVLIWNG